jgi:hypothetical protein
MAEKIWEFGTITETIKTPYEFLYEYASKLKDDTNNLIEGAVTELISESREEVVFALYLVVPELRNYSYRLIEVTQQNAFNFYPVKIKLFGTLPSSIVEKTIDNEKDFEKKLREFITSPLTKLILTSLRTHIEIYKDYQKP